MTASLAVHGGFESPPSLPRGEPAEVWRPLAELDADITVGDPSSMCRRTETPSRNVMRESDRVSQGSDGGAEPTLRESLSALLRLALRSTRKADTLRDAVSRYVASARERGDRVERVIVDLKREIHAAAGVGRYVTKEEQALTECVVRWCIEGYYGPPARRDHDRT